MSPTNETGLVAEIVTAIKSRYPGAWTFKVHGSPFQPVGTPDLLCCVLGQFVAFEVKHIKPGERREHAMERATPAQVEQIRRIRAAGGITGVVTSPEEAINMLRVSLRALERDC